MIGRLTHKSYIVNMSGASYRVKETKEWLIDILVKSDTDSGF